MSDLTKDGVTLILGEINTKLAAGNIPLSTSNVTLGVPSRSAAGTTDNSQIDVVAIAGQGYTGDQEITYNRLDIETVLTNLGAATPAIANAGTLVNASDLLAAINSTYALALVPADIVDGPINATAYPFAYTLNIADGSLVYTGSLPVSIDPTFSLVGTIANTGTVGTPYSSTVAIVGPYTAPLVLDYAIGGPPDWMTVAIDTVNNLLTFSGTPDTAAEADFKPRVTDSATVPSAATATLQELVVSAA
jgi:hypothetical protein